MIGRLFCFFNRHRVNRRSAWRAPNGVKYGECRRCGALIRQSGTVWVKKRRALNEGELDARAKAMAERQERRQRQRGHGEPG